RGELAAKDRSLSDEDTLLVPTMYWRLLHHFAELEGPDKRFRNPALQGLPMQSAVQVVQFKMDRRGAEVASEAVVPCRTGGPKSYHFAGPFLIVMQKRDAKHPFFAMWVDNAELMCRP